MACYAYSVLTRWFSSVYSGAGSRPSSDLMAKHFLWPQVLDPDPRCPLQADQHVTYTSTEGAPHG